MTYTLRNIPDVVWRQIKLNAEMSGLPIRTYILLVLERSNVKFKISDPIHADVAHKPIGDVQLEKGESNPRFDKR
jgi:hypothetical protein